MFKKMIRRSASFMAAVMVIAGIFSASSMPVSASSAEGSAAAAAADAVSEDTAPGDNSSEDATEEDTSEDMTSDEEAEELPDFQVLYEEKIRELGEEYGFVASGTKSFQAEMDYGDYVYPEEIEETDQGIVFADIYDYDGDSIPELLILRRHKGYVNFERTGMISAIERHEYLFEMYDYSIQEEDCMLTARFVAGVSDIMDVFMHHANVTVFRGQKDDKTYIFLETNRHSQDHPEDNSLIRLRYDNRRFTDCSGLRYGALFFGDKNVQCLKLGSAEAYGLLGYPGSARSPLWEVQAAADSYDDVSFKTALRTGLSEYGLKLRTTRNDIVKGYSRDKDGQNNLSAEDYIAEVPALECYEASEGELTPLCFLAICLGHGPVDKGFEPLKIKRVIYTGDPQGTERTVFTE